MIASPEHSFDQGIEVKQLEDGVLVSQNGQAYVARNWRLDVPVIRLIEQAISAGLGCMIRKDHPRKNARWPNTRGTVYLAFSPSPDHQWSLAIDSFNSVRHDFGQAVFS